MPMEGIGNILIRMFDEMVRELKDMRYVPQLKKNLISIGALEAQSLKETLRDGVLKMLKDSMVVLKDVRQNNMYYLKGSTVTGQVAASGAYDDSIRLWHMRPGHTGEKSLQALARKGLLKGAKTYKLKFCEHVLLVRRRR